MAPKVKLKNVENGRIELLQFAAESLTRRRIVANKVAEERDDGRQEISKIRFGCQSPSALSKLFEGAELKNMMMADKKLTR